MRGRKRVRVVKTQLRLAKLGNGLALDRDAIGVVNIGLKYLSSDGRPVALASTEPHEVWVELMNPWLDTSSTLLYLLLKRGSTSS
ncbi:hypothetical protein B6U99_05275 [Candidatus Geothermarchaeota archaeon ex4572_27]|nr:MAG: hypothetical protein B6U99_05275 [Candidatus Geothermarchaeota archaeon ex4572_27]